MPDSPTEIGFGYEEAPRSRAPSVNGSDVRPPLHSPEPPSPSLSPSPSNGGTLKRKSKAANWVESVDIDLAKGLGADEVKRQNAIFELCAAMHDFKEDLLLTTELLMEPLITRKDIIPDEAARKQFVADVFINTRALAVLHSKISLAIQDRQSLNPVVEHIADVYLKFVDQFDIYVEHCSKYELAKQIFSAEFNKNPLLQEFINEQIRNKAFRREEFFAILFRPNFRLGRYNMLLKEVGAKTKDKSNPEISYVQMAMEKTDLVAKRVDEQLGRVQLLMVENSLENISDFPSLQLRDPERQLLHEGPLKFGRTDLLARDVHVYFFDHFLLLVRGKKGEKQTILRQPFSWDQIRVMEPWEAETLVQGSIWQPDTAVTTSLQVHKSIRESFGTLRSKVFGGSKNSIIIHTPNSAAAVDNTCATSNVSQIVSKDNIFAIVLATKVPKAWYFHAATATEKKTWAKKVNELAEQASKSTLVYEPKITGTINSDKVNIVYEMVDPKINKKRLLVGTEEGLYSCILDPSSPSQGFVQLCEYPKITQVCVFPVEQCIAFLAHQDNNKTFLFTLSFDVFLVGTKEKPIKVRESEGASLIRVGVVNNKSYLISGWNRFDPTSNFIRMFECKEHACSSKNSNDRLGVHKTINFPNIMVDFRFSHQVTSKLVFVVCHKVHVSIINTENLAPYDAVDLSDPGMKAILDHQHATAINIFKLKNDFVVCFREFGIFMTKDGKKSREKHIQWVGHPKSFAVHEPYLLAFSELFFEVRSVETGEVIQIVSVQGLKHLNIGASQDTSSVYILSSLPMSTSNLYNINSLERVNEIAPFKAAGKTLAVVTDSVVVNEQEQDDDLGSSSSSSSLPSTPKPSVVASAAGLSVFTANDRG